MTSAQQLAKHFRDVFFGGNWTWVNLKETVADITWQQATEKIQSLNTIAALVFHINYYVAAILNVLQGDPLDAHDKYSFDVPAIQSEDEWQQLLTQTFDNAEQLTVLIEQLPESRLNEIFADEKYGTYYRNLMGVTEHTHYHLGQIALLKKIRQPAKTES